MKKGINYLLVNILITLCIIFLGYKTLSIWSGVVKEIISILLPFFISFVIAYSLYPLIKNLEKMGIRKKIANISVIILVVCFISMLFYILIPIIYNQLEIFIRNIYEILENLSIKYSIKFDFIKELVVSNLNELLVKTGNYISNGLIKIIISSLEMFTKIMVSFVVTIYLILDMDNIRDYIKKILSKKNKKLYKYLKNLDNELENYIGGTLLLIIIQLIEYSIVFLIIGHPNWLILAVLAAITSIIPYFGTLFSNIVALLLASLVSMKLFILTAIVCIILPNIDAYIISPKIYKKTNNINQVISIILTIIFGKLFGIVGLFISIPSYIIVKSVIEYFYNKN